MKNMRINMSFGLLIILIILLIAVVFYMQNSEKIEYATSYDDFSCADLSGWNQAEQTEQQFINYQNPQYGLSMKIPYNIEWGTQNVRVLPYEFNGLRKTLYFGYYTCKNGVKLRDYALDLDLPAEDVGQVMARVQKQFRQGVQQKMVGGFDVVEYFDNTGVAANTIELVGKKYNYLLQSFDSLVDMENLVNKIVLLE